MTRHHTTRGMASCLIAILSSMTMTEAWGLKGHRMQMAATMQALPADMPAFFRNAGPQLASLGTEPDRWRGPDVPAIVETSGTNHYFSHERAPKMLPPNRHLFIVELTTSGAIDAQKASLAPFGLAPYAIQEWGDMLTGAFRRWRQMKDDTADARIEKRQLEQSILFIAGVLAHWVTDVSQPMHCSVHILGWHPSVPNPAGYVTDRSIHGRYETEYVERAIDDREVQAALTQPPRELGDWLEESSRYIGACNTHVETIYRWDKTAPFGSGREPAEAEAFTATRLAEGAAMLATSGSPRGAARRRGLDAPCRRAARQARRKKRRSARARRTGGRSRRDRRHDERRNWSRCLPTNAARPVRGEDRRLGVLRVGRIDGAADIDVYLFDCTPSRPSAAFVVARGPLTEYRQGSIP